jgi:hypothetical protein
MNSMVNLGPRLWTQAAQTAARLCLGVPPTAPGMRRTCIAPKLELLQAAASHCEVSRRSCLCLRLLRVIAPTFFDLNDARFYHLSVALLLPFYGSMASKRSRQTFEADLQKQESPYVLYGTPLPPLDERVRDDGSFVPVWKQEVTDDRGRKRLHGAFTGGFSAG